MNRREFLTHSASLGVVGSLLPSVVFAGPSGSDKAEGSRRFTVRQSYQLKAPPGSEGPMRLWIPVPEAVLPYQVLRNLSWQGDFQSASLTTEPDYGATSLFVQWEDCQKPMALDVDMLIDTRDWIPGRQGVLDNYRQPEMLAYPPEVSRYLKADRYIKTDGIVKETAARIVGAETNPLRQARLIHDWVAANMERDNSVVGCGTGDVGQLLSTGKLYGKCTDINSVFVALARASGIPAREMFGIRLGRPHHLEQYSRTAFGSVGVDGQANITEWQHCRAQFWLHGIGWVPCDPADVTKMRLTEMLPVGAPAVQAVTDDLFGNWEMNWVGFNHGRDFVLEPSPEQVPLNNFGYPYAEAGGDPLDYYDSTSFAYAYRATESL